MRISLDTPQRLAMAAGCGFLAVATWTMATKLEENLQEPEPLPTAVDFYRDTGWPQADTVRALLACIRAAERRAGDGFPEAAWLAACHSLPDTVP